MFTLYTHLCTHTHTLNKTWNNNDFEICHSTHQHSNDTLTEIKNLDRVIKDSKYQTKEKSWKITLLGFKMKCKVTVIRHGLRIMTDVWVHQKNLCLYDHMSFRSNFKKCNGERIDSAGNSIENLHIHKHKNELFSYTAHKYQRQGINYWNLSPEL